MVTMEETDDFYFKVMKITMKICLRIKWVFKSWLCGGFQARCECPT